MSEQKAQRISFKCVSSASVQRSHQVCSRVQKPPDGGAAVCQHHASLPLKPPHSESASSDRCMGWNATTEEIRQKISVYFLNYFKSVHNKRYLLFHIKKIVYVLKCSCSEMFQLYKGFFEINTSVLVLNGSACLILIRTVTSQQEHNKTQHPIKWMRCFCWSQRTLRHGYLRKSSTSVELCSSTSVS